MPDIQMLDIGDEKTREHLYKEAFAISKRMMDGEKMNAFILELSFFGWYLVGVLTCGLAIIFYVQPYFEATMTEFYAYNKGKAYNEGYIR